MLKRLFLLVSILVIMGRSYSQVVTECPQNIGFESGTFQNWNLYNGFISGTGMQFQNAARPPSITLTAFTGSSQGQTILTGGVDPYGGFPLTAPNGSRYIVKLGNSNNGRGAEAISYVINVPANVDAYSVTFNYAVVFQNPDHEPDEQPKFTAQVTEISSGATTGCGSFEFVASSGLPGFNTSPQDRTVLYKPWSPVMVNLSDYRGRSIELRFTTNDCSRGGHFGYAYIDFNENCSIPIRGNVTCPENREINLSVLPGFERYRWFNELTGENLGSSETLRLAPVPPIGTRIAVELTPYSGLGCQQTLSTVITGMNMALQPPEESCLPVDLTAQAITVGNSSDISYTYWTDAAATVPIPDPEHVAIGGTYFIKGRSSSGCELVLPILLRIRQLVPIAITDPPTVNYPTTVDITQTFPHIANLTYTYWRNAEATLPLSQPERIRFSGTYYVKAASRDGCTIISPVNVQIVINGLIIPNTFTPNGDGINDVFTILTSNSITVKLVSIYNRWGTKVYETPEVTQYWTGMRENVLLPLGVYYYVVEGIENKVLFRRSGWVTMIR